MKRKLAWHHSDKEQHFFFIQSLFAEIIQCMDVHAMKVRVATK